MKKKEEFLLYAIYKKSTHLGNSYGRTEIEAIKKYLRQSYSIQIPNISIEEILEVDNLNDFKAIKAISEVHYFKSRFLEKSDGC